MGKNPCVSFFVKRLSGADEKLEKKNIMKITFICTAISLAISAPSFAQDAAQENAEK